jgi:hypothetical protein
MSLDILLLILGDWRWHLKTLLIAAICASYALAAIWAAQSRENWIIRGLIVCGLLALFLPPRAHEPLLFFLLMLPTLGALTAWQTWRRNPASGDTSPRFQYSLRTLLLGLALLGSMLGLALAALRDRLIDNWLPLPIAAVMIALVANQAWRLVTVRRKVIQALVWLGVTLAWICAETFWLGDWLAVGTLLGVFHFAMLGNYLQNLIVLAIQYTAFSLLIVLGGTVARMVSSPSLSPRARRAWLTAMVLSLTGVGVPVAWVYIQMAMPAKSMPPFVEDDNCYPELVEFAQANSTVPPSGAKHLELVKLLERPGAVPLDLNRDVTPDTRMEYVGFRDIARSLRAAGDASAKTGKYDEAAEYALANIRMGLVLQRGGNVLHFLVGHAIETTGQHSLAKIRDKVSSVEQQRLIAQLVRVDESREPVGRIEERDRIFDDRSLRWSHRLETVFSRQIPEGTVTQNAIFQFRVTAYGRLMATDLAIREFQAANGRWPASLNELVPNYLAAVPKDPFSDEPLRYRADGKSFVVYSIGQDRRDDGGKFGNHQQSIFEAGYDLDIDTMLRPQP